MKPTSIVRRSVAISLNLLAFCLVIVALEGHHPPALSQELQLERQARPISSISSEDMHQDDALEVIAGAARDNKDTVRRQWDSIKDLQQRVASVETYQKIQDHNSSSTNLLTGGVGASVLGSMVLQAFPLIQQRRRRRNGISHPQNQLPKDC